MASDMGVINACEWDAFLPASVRGSMESFTLLDDELSTGVEFVNFRLFEEPCETDWVLPSEQTSMEQHRFQATFAKVEVPVPPPCSVGMGPMVQFDSPIRPPLARSQHGVNLSRTVDVPPAPQSLGLHALEPGHSGWGRTLQARADVPCFNTQQPFPLPARLQVADDGRQQLCSTMEDCNAAFKIQMRNRVDTCSPPADAAVWPSNSSSSVVTITRGTCVTTEMTKPAGAGPVSGGSTTSSPSTMDVISTGHIHALRQCVDRVASVSGPLSALSEIEHAADDQLVEAPCPSPTLSKAATSSTVAAAPTGANKRRSRQDVAASMAVTAGPVKKSSKRMSCWNCGAHSTPQWRCGPDGPRTLCNACGVRYKKGLPLAYLSAREAEANKQAPSPMSEESAAATP